MTQPRVPSCGRHLGKFDDVTIYPVLVVARTVSGEEAVLVTPQNLRIISLGFISVSRGGTPI